MAASPYNVKSKENDDEWNLFPTVTYRHVLSQSTGVHNPLRVIGLCDMDAFYAQCEQKRLGIDPKLPVVVLQWDSLIAVNYPAREFGIKRMTKLKEAQQICPNLVVVHVATYKDGENEAKYHSDPDTKTHKVSLDLYRRESTKIVSIFKSTLPGAEVEKASVDEAFIDFTRPVQRLLVERYPELAAASSDPAFDLDTPLPPPPSSISWHPSCNLLPVLGEGPSSDDQTREGKQEGESDKAAPPAVTWADVALSIGAELMFTARDEILQSLGYTTSAGIARNKFLAKLVASYKKPASQSVLRNAAIPSYLPLIPFQKIRFLGGKLGRVIAEVYESNTVGDLLPISLGEMQKKLGSDCIWVYQLLRGIDISEVKEKPPVSRSMLASKNLPEPIRKDADMYLWTRVLCSELAVRLLEAREHGVVWPKSLVLHTRQSGESAARSKQAPFPYVRDLNGDVIQAAVAKLWKDLHGTDSERAANPSLPPMKIFHISLAFTGVAALEQGQRGIQRFLAGQEEVSPTSLPAESGKKNDDVECLKYRCPTCSKVITEEVARSEDADMRTLRLNALKAEHEDFHFAQNLARKEKVVIGGAGKRKTSPDRARANKRRKEEVTIASFFPRK